MPPHMPDTCRILTALVTVACSILDILLTHFQLLNVCSGFPNCPPFLTKASSAVHALLYLITACFGIFNREKRCRIVTYLVLSVLVGYISGLNTINYAIEATTRTSIYHNGTTALVKWLSVVNGARLLSCIIAVFYSASDGCRDTGGTRRGQPVVVVDRPRARPQQGSATTINMGYVSQAPPAYNQATSLPRNPAVVTTVAPGK